MSTYVDDWVDCVKRGIRSYIDVLKMTKDARGYHGSRSSENPDEIAPSRFPIKAWVPLLWGTF